MVTFKFPPNVARYQYTFNLFSATFNVPTIGVYDFGKAANNFQTVFLLEKNSIYLIDQISTGGNIPESDYFSSIKVTPQVFFSLKVTRGEPVFVKSFPVVQYLKGQEFTTVIKSEKGGDALQMSVTGILNQTSNTVGITPINISVSLSVYEINEKNANIYFRDAKQF